MQLFEVPVTTPTAECRSCHATIYFVKMKSGKMMPVDCSVDGGRAPIPANLNLFGGEDSSKPGLGASHFATCPSAQQHRNPRG